MPIANEELDALVEASGLLACIDDAYIERGDWRPIAQAFAEACTQRLTATIREQSAEIERLRKDAERIDWLESSKTSHGFQHTEYGEYRYYAHQQAGCLSVRETIDAAIAAQGGGAKS